jgi:Domain of unknown function (DUF4158)
LRCINGVSFLTAAQRDRYGHYPDVVTPDDLYRCFHLSDDDRAQIMSCRGHHNRLGFALQLSTVRYLGTFLDDPIAVPSSVLQSLPQQLAIHTLDGLQKLSQGRTARGACNKDPQTLWLRRHHRAAGGLPNDALALRRVLDRHRTAGCAVRPRHRLVACPQDSTAGRQHAGAFRRQRARPGRSPSISAVDAGGSPCNRKTSCNGCCSCRRAIGFLCSTRFARGRRASAVRRFARRSID